MTVAKRILVTGRVQGVFYRDSCRREAERLSVSGSARNLDDGRVEVIAEGDEDAVNQLIDWCQTGPSHADVDSVEVADADPSGSVGFSTD